VSSLQGKDDSKSAGNWMLQIVDRQCVWINWVLVSFTYQFIIALLVYSLFYCYCTSLMSIT